MPQIKKEAEDYFVLTYGEVRLIYTKRGIEDLEAEIGELLAKEYTNKLSNK